MNATNKNEIEVSKESLIYWADRLASNDCDIYAVAKMMQRRSSRILELLESEFPEEPKEFIVMGVTFQANQNEKYGDFRVDKYLDGVWVNQRDCNWSKEQATDIAKNYQTLADKGFMTMSDNF